MNNIYLYFVGFLCLSCSTESEEFISLDVGQELLFAIPTNGYVKSIAHSFQPVGSNAIYIYDTNTQELIAVDCANGELRSLGRFNFGAELSALSIDEETGSALFSVDDIVYIVDLNDVKNVDSISFAGAMDFGYFFALNESFGPVLRQDEIRFHLFAADFDNSFKDPKFFEFPFEALYNLRDSSISIIESAQYPANYREGSVGLLFAPERISLGAERHVYFFAYNDSAFFIDLNSGDREAHFMGSFFHRPSVELVPFDQIETLNPAIFREQFSRNDAYIFPYYGAFSKLYIRQLKLGFQIDSGSSQDSLPSKRDNIWLIYSGDDIEYIGEWITTEPKGIPVDTDKGLRTFRIVSDTIYIREIKINE